MIPNPVQTLIKAKIEKVRKWRANSNRVNTKKLAETPTIFANSACVIFIFALSTLIEFFIFQNYT